jgi:ATP-binding cassette subfamily B protein
MSFIMKLQWFFKQRWPHYTIAISLMVIMNIMSVVAPKIIGDVTDQIRSGALTATSLNLTVLFLISLAIIGYVIFFSWLNLLFGSSILLEKELRSRLLKHLVRMSPSFFHRNRTGELMALATNDIPAISNTAGFGVLTLVSTIVGTSIVLVAMILFVDIQLTLASLLPLPILVYAVNKIGKKMRTHFLAAQDSFGHMNDHALESISGLRVLRAYVQENKDIEAFDNVTMTVMHKNLKVAFVNALFQPVISTIVGLSYAIGIGYGSYLVFHNEITLGQLFTFNIYLGLLIWPMISFGEFINILQRGNASLDRVENSFAQKPEVQDIEHPISVSQPTRIEMNQLSFRYPGATTDSLQQISIKIHQGDTLGIVGRTGSGKSTLLKQLLRQYPIEPEKLFISGVPIESIALNQVLQWIGYVPQEHLLLSKTILENIKVGNPEASIDEVKQVIDAACFTKDIEQMSQGWDTVIGESGVMLSGGQKQRTAIARALLVDPEILILDDVLSAVDAKTETRIINNIRQLRQGQTTLIATHRLSAVSHASWIVVLEQGQIIEEGTHEQLLLLDGWYKQQYNHQQLEAAILNEGKENTND